MIHLLAATIKGALILLVATRFVLWLLRPEDKRWLRGIPMNMFPVMFAIGMLGHTIWVAYLALLLLLPVIARSRAEAIILLPLAMMTMPPLGWMLGVGGIYLLRFEKWFFLALGLLIVGLRFREKRVSEGRHFDLAFWLMLALLVFQVRDMNVTSTLRELVNPIVTFALPYFFMSRWLKEPEDVRRFILSFGCSGLIMSVVAIAESRMHWLIYDGMSGALGLPAGLSNYSHSRGGLIRAVGSYGEATGFGLFLTMTFLATLASRSSFRSRSRWLVALAVGLLGIISVNSRNAIVGLVLGLIAFDLYRGRFGALAGKIALVGLCYTAALAAAQFSPYIAASIGKTDDSASTVQYRTLLYRRGMEEIRRHPLVGRPLGDVSNSLQDLRQGEGIIDFVNGYIFYGLTEGVGGIVALLLVFISTMWALVRVRAAIAISQQMKLIAGCCFAVATLSIVTSFYTGFGGTSSAPYLMLTAAASAMIAGRKLVQPDAKRGHVRRSEMPLSDDATMIEPVALGVG